MVCRPTLHQTNRSKLHVACCVPDRDPLSLSRHDCTLSVTDHLFYDTCHVICRMRASYACIRCRAVWCTTSCVMCPWCTPRVTLYCCMPSSRGILHVVCLRTSSMLRHSTRCYNRVYSVATHCCSAVHRLAMQCTMLHVAHLVCNEAHRPVSNSSTSHTAKARPSSCPLMVTCAHTTMHHTTCNTQ